nr:hypothetical protein [Microbacterium humi]
MAGNRCGAATLKKPSNGLVAITVSLANDKELMVEFGLDKQVPSIGQHLKPFVLIETANKSKHWNVSPQFQLSAEIANFIAVKMARVKMLDLNTIRTTEAQELHLSRWRNFEADSLTPKARTHR